MATQNNNITKVEVFLVDVNDQQPVFVADSLLAAVAEEAEFDTTVTVLKVCPHTHRYSSRLQSVHISYMYRQLTEMTMKLSVQSTTR